MLSSPFLSSPHILSHWPVLFYRQKITASSQYAHCINQMSNFMSEILLAHRHNYILDILGCRMITEVIIQLCSLRNSSESLEFSPEEIISDYKFFILYVFLGIELVLRHLYNDYFKFLTTFELLIHSLIHLSIIFISFLFIENRFLSLTMHPDHSFPSLCSSQLSLIPLSLISPPPPFPL